MAALEQAATVHMDREISILGTPRIKSLHFGTGLSFVTSIATQTHFVWKLAVSLLFAFICHER
jgi:hypothetical protein